MPAHFIEIARQEHCGTRLWFRGTPPTAIIYAIPAPTLSAGASFYRRRAFRKKGAFDHDQS
jgi:hypothetical protein